MNTDARQTELFAFFVSAKGLPATRALFVFAKDGIAEGAKWEIRVSSRERSRSAWSAKLAARVPQWGVYLGIVGRGGIPRREGCWLLSVKASVNVAL